LEEMLRQELTMQGVGVVFDEIMGSQPVGTQEREVREVGIGRGWLDFEREGWGESAVAARCVTQEKTVGQERIGSEQEATGGQDLEMIRAFKNRWPGVSTTGRTIADDEAGNVALGEAQLEIGEEVAQTLVSPAVLVREEADEGIEYHKTGVNPFNSLKEVGKVFWEGKRARVGGLR
jgi:hypothetical protein